MMYEDVTNLITLLNIKNNKIIFGKGVNDCYYNYGKYIILKKKRIM